MSGHSKWSKVKHQKESTDAIKGKAFTKLASSIIIAVKEGGGISDPSSNFRLRLAIEKARQSNMPKENIERAIEKGAGKAEEGNLKRIVYEAFGPGKVGIIIEAHSDNHQRTASEIKNLLEKGGGVLAAQGAVSYLFNYIGMIEVAKKDKNYDQMTEAVIEAGGEDIREGVNSYIIYTKHEDLHKVKINLEKAGFQVIDESLLYKPVSVIKAESQQKAKLEALIAFLENLDDVQKVYSNCL